MQTNDEVRHSVMMNQHCGLGGVEVSTFACQVDVCGFDSPSDLRAGIHTLKKERHR